MRFGPPSASSIRMATARAGSFPVSGFRVLGFGFWGFWSAWKLGALSFPGGLRGLRVTAWARTHA